MKKIKNYKIHVFIKIFTCLLFIFAGTMVATVPACSQSLFDENSFGNELYQDITACKVGDTVTVIILQNAKADQSTETKNGRQASLDTSFGIQKGTGFLDFIPSASAGAKASGQTSHSGTRNISRQVNFIATVTAQVVEVLPNGQLKIKGSQYTSINDQKTEISVSGIINKSDILPDNSVPSSAIANAQIEYRDPSPKEHKVVSIVTFPFRLIGSIVAFPFRLTGKILGWVF